MTTSTDKSTVYPCTNSSEFANESSLNKSSPLAYLFEVEPSRMHLLQSIFFSISVIQTVLTCSGSALIIAAIWRTPSLWTMSNTFIVSLASADFLTGLSFPYMSMVFLPCFHEWLDGSKVACLSALFASWFLGAACVNSMVFVALDRFLYVVYPFRYDVYVTPPRTKAIIALSWLVPCLVASSVLIWNRWTPQTYCSILTVLDKAVAADMTLAVFSAMSVVILSAYLSILRVAQRQRRSVAPMGVTVPQWQVIKMLAMVFGVYTACWVPTVVVLEVSFAKASLAWLLYLSYPITCLNSGLNFFIFGYVNAEFRRAFKRMICDRNRNVISDSSQQRTAPT